ncbi:MAG: hypothetical protein ABT940_03880 [Alphaproteobacteria bacterium]
MAYLVMLLSLFALPARASVRVECRCIADGEDRVVSTAATATPYAEPLISISYRFQFRAVVVETPPEAARIALYTYVNREDGPRLAHYAMYPWPPPTPASSAEYGFTGHQFVYEPDGGHAEFQYWCRLNSGAPHE